MGSCFENGLGWGLKLIISIYLKGWKCFIIENFMGCIYCFFVLGSSIFKSWFLFWVFCCVLVMVVYKYFLYVCVCVDNVMLGFGWNINFLLV